MDGRTRFVAHIPAGSHNLASWCTPSQGGDGTCTPNSSFVEVFSHVNAMRESPLPLVSRYDAERATQASLQAKGTFHRCTLCYVILVACRSTAALQDLAFAFLDTSVLLATGEIQGSADTLLPRHWPFKNKAEIQVRSMASGVNLQYCTKPWDPTQSPVERVDVSYLCLTSWWGLSMQTVNNVFQN